MFQANFEEIFLVNKKLLSRFCNWNQKPVAELSDTIRRAKDRMKAGLNSYYNNNLKYKTQSLCKFPLARTYNFSVVRKTLYESKIYAYAVKIRMYSEKMSTKSKSFRSRGQKPFICWNILLLISQQILSSESNLCQTPYALLFASLDLSSM